jgi:large repetitive protein
VPSFELQSPSSELGPRGFLLGLTFNAATRQVSGTPTTPGSWTLTYSAFDVRVSTPTSFTLTVEANTPPQAPSVANQTGIRTSPVYWVAPAFTDANGDVLSYSMTPGLPPGLSFNPSTREVSGTPTTAGSWTVTYTANDNRGGVASTTFGYVISNPAQNLPPALNGAVQNQTFQGGAPFSFSFPANLFVDPEGGAVTYGYQVIGSGMPNPANWLQFDAATRTFSTANAPNFDVWWTIRVRAYDTLGQASDPHDFTLTLYEYIYNGGGGGGGGPRPQSIGGETLSFEMGIDATPSAFATQSAQASSGPIAPQVQDRWFTYDAENRLRISGGVLSGAAGAVGTSIVLGKPSPRKTATRPPTTRKGGKWRCFGFAFRSSSIAHASPGVTPLIDVCGRCWLYVCLSKSSVACSSRSFLRSNSRSTCLNVDQTRSIRPFIHGQPGTVR